MLYFDRNDVFKGINANKASGSKECDICHNWCFLNFSIKFQPNVCDRCYDLLMMSLNLSDIGFDYRCIMSLISKNEDIKLLRNADLTKKSGTL